MKVLHLKDLLVDPETGNLGGMERSLLWMIEDQLRRGWRVELWVAKRVPKAPPGLGASVRIIPPFDHRRPDHLLRLASLLRACAPQVLHTHGYWAGAAGRPAAVLAGVPARVHKVASAYRREYRWTHRWTERILSLITGRVVAVSPDVREFLVREIGVAPEKVAVIPNGIPEPRLSGDRAGARAELGVGMAEFLVVGLQRLDEGKGLFDVIEAAALLRAGPAPGVRLLLAGDGPLRARVEEAARLRLGPGGWGLTGWVWELGRILDAADAFVLASEEREGFSTALVHAMAARVPAVATRVGGNVEALDGGACGRLVPPRDPAALAAALAAIASDRAAAADLARKARARYEANYRIEATAGRIAALYEDILRAGSGGEHA